MSNTVKIQENSSTLTTVEFAKHMNSCKAVIDRFDAILTDIRNDMEGKLTRMDEQFSGSLTKRYVGKEFARVINGKAETGKMIRIDLFFDQCGHCRIKVSFWEEIPGRKQTGLLNKLLQTDLAFCATNVIKISDKNGNYIGRWFRVPLSNAALNNALESDNDFEQAKEDIKDLITKVLSKGEEVKE